MKIKELIERLADKEHAGWARWQKYLHSRCGPDPTHSGQGALLIFPEDVKHWKKQIATDYADLPEHFKESDRNEVRMILPDIYEFGRSFLANGNEVGYLPWLAVEEWNRVFEEEGIDVW